MQGKIFAVLATLAVISFGDGFKISREVKTGDPVLPDTDIVRKPVNGGNNQLPNPGVPVPNDNDDNTSDNSDNDDSSSEEVVRMLEKLMEKNLGALEVKEELLEELSQKVEEKSSVMKKRYVNTACTGSWPASSTICLYQDNAFVTVKGVSHADKQIILGVHNAHRSNVSPTARAMQKMYWSSELEALAQKWAQVCSNKAHDENPQRKVPGWGIHIGQNAAFNYASWKDAINGWHNEVNLFFYGAHYGSNWVNVGHYTQVVRDVATAIGCGYAICGNVPRYICNYAFGNPSVNNIGFPYVDGATCQDCPGNCYNNLCDCKGLVCKNGGILNPRTCTCTCAGSLWTGADCGTKNLSACKDPAYCTLHQPYGYFGLCAYDNVPIECPKMCGVC